MEYYVHQVPGRLRVRIPVIRTEPCKSLEVKEILENLNAVHNITVNPVTGSVVVGYDDQAQSGESILACLAEHGYFDQPKAVTNDQYLQSAATKAGKTIGKVLFSWAIGRVLNGTPLSVLTALV